MIPRQGKFLSVFAALVLSASACVAQSVMTHHVRDVVKNGKAQANGRLPGNQVLQLDLVLPLRDSTGLKAFLADVYNPASPNYRQFLTPTEFTARFGPTADDYDAVVRFAKTYGFEVVGGSRDRMLVQVKGSVSNIEAAFHVNMRNYQHPTESRTFYSPDAEPRLDLPFNLWHISGLDNYSIPKPLLINKDEYAAAHGIQPEQVVSHATTGSGPSASFLGSDMRAAYYGSGTLTGAGQNLGLWEYLGTDLADLNTYFTNVHQTNNVPITLLSTDGTSTSCVYRPGRCDDGEQTLDMTQAIGMAPGLASLTMFVGSTDTAIISSMTTHTPLSTTIGCSWGWTPADPSTLDPYFEQMAAQGQNFFAASGDYSTWTKTGNSAAWPADDAYVVSVGGTDLITAGAGGAWASETAWADSGGGISPDSIAIPSWQKLAGVINSSNNGSTTLRNGPDVSANANFTFYTCGDQKACQANYYGGTSFAAPMWAGLVALANQQYAVANPGKTIGFINPGIYQQNTNASTYAANFHDITSGTSGSYSAVTGFDLVTGWGSPTPALVTALSGAPTSSFTVSSSSSSGSIVQGGSSSPAATITVTPANGFDSSVALSASGQPSGVTVTFNPTSVSSSGWTSAMSISVGSSVAPGTYAITVTGTSGTIIQNTSFSLTVTQAQSLYYITTSSPTATVSRGGSTGLTVTAHASSGSPAISLSASGEPRGISISFSPTSISPSSPNSNMSIKANRNATPGSYAITITGSGSGILTSTTVTLTIQ